MILPPLFSIGVDDGTFFSSAVLIHFSRRPSLGMPSTRIGRLREMRIATAQFENRDNDKAFNPGRIDQLAGRAAPGDAIQLRSP